VRNPEQPGSQFSNVQLCANGHLPGKRLSYERWFRSFTDAALSGLNVRSEAPAARMRRLQQHDCTAIVARTNHRNSAQSSIGSAVGLRLPEDCAAFVSQGVDRLVPLEIWVVGFFLVATATISRRAVSGVRAGRAGRHTKSDMRWDFTCAGCSLDAICAIQRGNVEPAA
jgi:hypothetical protein